MASYATIDDLITRLPERTVLDLCHDPELGGEKKIDDPFVVARYEKALDDATRYVDSFILPVHDVPLSPPYPERIVEVVVVVGAHNLYKRRVYADANPYTQEFTDEKEWLGKLSKGTVRLYFDPGTEEDKRIRSRVRTNVTVDNTPSEIPDEF